MERPSRIIGREEAASSDRSTGSTIAPNLRSQSESETANPATVVVRREEKNFKESSSARSMSLEGYQLLFEAILNDSTEMAKLLITNGCRIVDDDRGSPPETTPLHEAVKKGEVEIVELLLERGADVNIKDKEGKSPLYRAIERFSANEERTKQDIKVIIKIPIYRGSGTRLHTVYMVRDVTVHACCTGSFIDGLVKACSIVNNILVGGAYVSSVRTLAERDGYRALHFSSCETDREELVLLIMRRAEPRPGRANGSTAKDEDYWTELFSGMVAASHRDKKMLRILREHGAAVDTEDNSGKTLLERAVESGCSKVVEGVLKSSPKPNYRSNRNSLKIAINRLARKLRERSSFVPPCESQSYETHTEMEYRRIAEILLGYGFMVDPRDSDDREFLTSSIATGFKEIVEDLLEYGAEVNMLDTAAMNKQPEIAELLLAHGADVNAKHSGGGGSAGPDDKSPIIYAIQNIDIDMTKMLLAKGAEIRRDADSLNMAIIMGSREIVDILLEHAPDIDINAADKDGATALHCTASDRRDLIRFSFDSDRPSETDAKVEIATMLLNRGAQVNARSKTGLTALIIAVKNQRSKLLENLLKFNADIETVVDERGNSALHIAASNNDLESIKILLKHGANVNGRNREGKTALYVACEEANLETVQILLSYEADINIGCYRNNNDVAGDNVNEDTPIIVANEKLTRLRQRRRLARNENFSSRSGSTLRALEEILDMLKYRLIEMIGAMNRNINEANIQWFRANAIPKQSLEECRDESARMKKETIVGNDSNVTFFDVLANHVNQVAMYARDESIVRVLESNDYDDKFPIYSKMISEHFKAAQRRLMLLNSSSRIINFLCDYALPEVAVREILRFFRDDDLENLIAAFHKPNVSPEHA